MTRGPIILVAVLLLFSPLMALDADGLFRACRKAQIILVIQTWSSDTLQNRGLAKQPVFPDNVAEVFSAKLPSTEARVDALIQALAPPLAAQDFHIFRVGEVLWIAPQEAPPLFNASLHLAEATNYSVDGFMEALAMSCGCTVPPTRVRIIIQNGARIRLNDAVTLPFDPGDWSLARALLRFVKVNRAILGWTVFCCPAPAGSAQKYYFEVHPVIPAVIPPAPGRAPLPEGKPFPKIAEKRGVSDLLLRFDDAHPQKKW